jgi:L-alanine-DL-glutamate epimerase-like enolase superfamily enzyme
MRVEAVDLFYLRMPEVLDIGDGSQDAALVRVRAGGVEGWGQCEASPLACAAALIAPMSHFACKPVAASVVGAALDSPEDIRRIGDRVRAESLDLLQAEHTLSGIDIALWDALGRARGEPVWRLLGYGRTYPKRPYASVLFGKDAQETREKARRARADGFTAAKFGWAGYGHGSAAADRDHVVAAREGLGPEADLLIDAGTVWSEDLGAARQRLAALREARATWLEEPFHTGALAEYGALARESGPVRLAGGEGSHNVHMARHLIDHGGVGFIQIDTGRIGGIAPAKRVADYARARDVTFVNHTFTSQLSLCASLQPYAGVEEHSLCEYPTESKPLSEQLTRQRLARGADGLVRVPDGPGLGLDIDRDTVRRYLVDTEIRVAGATIYRTPEL